MVGWVSTGFDGLTEVRQLSALAAPAEFLRGAILRGILCIVLHITLIGWIPATI